MNHFLLGLTFEREIGVLDVSRKNQPAAHVCFQPLFHTCHCDHIIKIASMFQRHVENSIVEFTRHLFPLTVPSHNSNKKLIKSNGVKAVANQKKVQPLENNNPNRSYDSKLSQQGPLDPSICKQCDMQHLCNNVEAPTKKRPDTSKHCTWR